MLLEVMNIRKTYGKVVAVEDVSFSIGRGEVFGLLGENGAGKTTTIKMLSTLATPDSGRILLNGRDIRKYRRETRKSIAVVSQDMNLGYELSVFEVLYIYALLRGIRNSKKLIDETIAKMGMTEKRNSKVGTLSGGQKRRVMAARAMLSGAELIFMDEPTIGLDPAVRREMWDIIRQMQADGRSILLTTHYTDEAEYLCGRVAIMEKGRIVSMDTPQSLIDCAGAFAVDINSRTLLFRDNDAADDYIAKESLTGHRVRRTKLDDVLVSSIGRAV
ncbi:ABC transporter ATP-binding protein [Seleniivibrio sp.]|uniref:ABC transporter ATP-binding protein n=1 Tax=Seleniivibrio sp. TaxID=2898801 RepID=UPI0025FECB7B|nr:ABC transporter ATP-binding protein [Seleniivibrio sp.]MCD8553503.1 ABC transporter ATP-binding protein [Seleniivibrio sp.]